MSKKIILIGNYDGTNVGDNSIMLELYKKFSKKGKIIIPSRQNKFISNKYNVNSVNILSLEFLKYVIKSDIIIIGGGGIFSKYSGPFVKLLPFFSIFTKIMGKKIIYYSLGVYDSTPKLLLNLLKISMIFSDEISVRDNSSLKTLGFISKIKKVKLVDDPGIYIKPIYRKKAIKLLHNGINLNKKSILFGLSLKYVKNKELNKKIIQIISKIIDYFTSKYNIHFIFFPFCFNKKRYLENDYNLAMEISFSLRNKSKFSIFPTWNYKPNEIKGIIGCMNYFLGMRFHSIIFSHTMNIPLVGISYEQKCKDFLKLNKIMYIDVEKINFNILLNMINKMMKAN